MAARPKAMLKVAISILMYCSLCETWILQSDSLFYDDASFNPL